MKTFKEFIIENQLQNESKTSYLGKATLLGLGLAGGIIGGSKMLNVGNFAQQSQENPTITNTEIPNTQTPPVATQNVAKSQSTIHHDAIKKMVIEDEEIRTKMYKDSKGIPTVGVGHNLNASNSASAFTKAFGNQGSSIRQHVMGGGSLTSDQAKKLFDVDYEHHLNQALKLTPNLAEHHPLVQASIVSGTYRGHWGGSPTARKLFSQGKFDEAAKELLNNREYREAAAKVGKHNVGIDERMERDANNIRQYGSSGNIDVK